MGIQVSLTDDDAMRYMKWLANMRQPQKQAEQQPVATTVTNEPNVTRREQLKDIRKWAARHGFQIAAKGRIPQPVMEAYERAH
jgi:hypothetical protein